MNIPVDVFPGISTALARLRAAGFALAVITSKPRGLLDGDLDKTGVGELFDLLVHPDDLAESVTALLDTLRS